MVESLERVEVATLLAVAQDHAFGQPSGAQLRATVLAQHIADGWGLGAHDRATTWWTSTLRFLGCTGHAFETAVMFGDEIELRAWSLEADAADPVAFLRKMLSRAGAGRAGLGRVRAVVSMLIAGKAAAEQNFRAACEVADAFAVRLGLPDDVREALATNFERWNGKGLPSGVRTTAIPVSMRIAQIAQELEVLARHDSIDAALSIVGQRRGRSYDPELTDLVLAHGHDWYAAVEEIDPWREALALAPRDEPHGAADHEALLVLLADFADLKSPWTAGHSRGVAELATRACGPAALAPALLHDLGRVAVPNSIWDKPGPLSLDERDRVETHALVTDQLLRRIDVGRSVLDAASAAHERVDGSGYHRRAGAGQLDEIARVIAAADCYEAMVTDRPHRRALAPDAAVVELRAMATDGKLDGEAVERVLEAAGHRRRSRTPAPAGLTAREVEVLRLLALGLTTRQVAEHLVISAKTADRHIQNIYKKIGATTRGAAALFAVEHGILVSDA